MYVDTINPIQKATPQDERSSQDDGTVLFVHEGIIEVVLYIYII